MTQLLINKINEKEIENTMKGKYLKFVNLDWLESTKPKHKI